VRLEGVYLWNPSAASGASVRASRISNMRGQDFGASAPSHTLHYGPVRLSTPGLGMVVTARAWNLQMRIMHGNGMFTVGLWNCRALEARFALVGTGVEAKATRAKLEWLDTHLVPGAGGPSVLFLLEVSGGVVEFRPLRRWLKQRGYDSHFTPGECTVDEVSGTRRLKNGIVTAVCGKEASFARAGKSARKGLVDRLCCRTVRVEVRGTGEPRDRVLYCVHGLHGPNRSAKGDVLLRWDGQLEAMQDAMLANMEYGSLVVGDINRIPCRRWRTDEAGAERTNAQLSADDRALRKFAGFRCQCCPVEGEGEGRECIVGAHVMASGSPQWTRMATKDGEWIGRRAKLDMAMEMYGDRGTWRPGAVEFAADADGTALSDHALVTWTSELISSPLSSGETRPMPVRLAKGSAVTAAFESKVANVSAAEWRACAQAARDAGTSELATYTERLRHEAVEATAEVAKADEATAEHAAGMPAVQQTERGNHNSWKRRLLEARALRTSGVDCFSVNGGVLFHQATGLTKTRAYAKETGVAPWDAVVAKCRREVVRAGRRVRRADRAADAELLRMARELEHCPDLGSRLAKIWRAIAGRKGGARLNAIFKGDKRGGREIHHTDPEFKPELGRIGKSFVQALDEGAVPEAFLAWCRVFDCEFEEIQGLDGGEWVMAKEMTWELFQEVLHSMPKGKAAGEGGFTVELLRAASRDIQFGFFEALMNDVNGRVVPKAWHSVLYALLPKPAPNDNAIVGENREIALMPVDMKMFLQMIRRAAHAKLVARIAVEQAGWCAGVGCIDPSLAVSIAIQNSARLQQPLWLLYLDLATFFPKIDRGIADMSAFLKGLPEEVIEMTTLIFGGMDDHEEAIKCRYESAAGLGDAFSNWMGCLMGCVLSPDRAKLLLNSILAAIGLVAKGVTLFGYSPEERERTLAHICSVAFADDWCGCFQSEREVRRAWEMWATWEIVSGSGIGVKGLGKTVVTSVVWIDGVPVDGPDPKLVRNGPAGACGPPGLVPFLSCAEAYKHLGLFKCADGSWRPAWAKLKKHFDAALARIRRMRSRNRDEIIIVGGALLGGLGGFYLSNFYATREELRGVDSKFVNILNSKMGLPRGSPWALTFGIDSAEKGVGKARRRPMMWEVQTTAIYSNFCSVMADVADTPWKRAARSAVALAMAKWGVCGDPARACLTHLVPEIERSLREAPVRHLADAMLLAIASAEEQMVVCEGREYMLARRRVQAMGRWTIHDDTGGVLSGGASHFALPDTPCVFTPLGEGGLGAPTGGMAALLHAGCISVGCFCDTPFASQGEPSFRWLANFDDAKRRHPSLSRAVKLPWLVAMAWLRKQAVPPSRPESCRQFVLPTVSKPQSAAPRRPPRGWERPGGVSLVRVLAAQWRGKEGGPPPEAWADAIRVSFGVGDRRSLAVEWKHGGSDRQERANGPRIFDLLSGDGEYSAHGGEASWLAGRASTCEGVAAESPPVVDDDGFVVGWEQRFAAVVRRFVVDDEAFLVHGESTGQGGSGRRVLEGELDGLEPIVQMYVRARVRIGECKIVDIPEVVKFTGRVRTLNVWVCRRSFREMAMWCARVDATDVFSLDASWDKVRNEDGIVQIEEANVTLMRGARAATHHSGRVDGGVLSEPEGDNNYIGEAVAHLDMHASRSRGARIVVMFDALSPVQAMHRFARRHNRVRQTFNISELLESWRQALGTAAAIVHLWRTSHVGDTINEWPDAEAGAMVASTAAPTAVPRARGLTHRSMRFNAHRKGAREWMADMSRRACVAKLRETSVDTQYWEEGDLVIGTLSGEHERLLDKVLTDRCCMGDAKMFRGVDSALISRQAGCPFECKHADGSNVAYTWSHACLACDGEPLVERRAIFLERVSELNERTGARGKVQLYNLIKLMKRLDSAAAGHRDLPPERDAYTVSLNTSARRAVGRLFEGTGDPLVDKNPEVILLARRAAAAGAELVRVAVREQRELCEQVTGWAKEMAIQRKWSRRWRNRVLAGGPRRAAELAQDAMARDTVYAEVRRRLVAREMLWTEAAGMRSRARALVRKRAVVIRERGAARMTLAASGEVAAKAEVVREWLLAALVARLKWRKSRGPFMGSSARRAAPPLTGAKMAWRHGAEFWREAIGEVAPVQRPCVSHDGQTVDGAYWTGSCERARAARRAFDSMGGRKLLRSSAKILMSGKHRRAVLDGVLARDLARFRATGSCSGASIRLEPDREARMPRLIDCTRLARRSKGGVEKRRREAKAKLMRQVTAGVEADDGGRWAVERIADVGLEGRKQVALVQWVGGQPDEWLHVALLSADLRRAARQMRETKSVAAAQAAASRPSTRAATRKRGGGTSAPSRKSARVAGRAADGAGAPMADYESSSDSSPESSSDSNGGAVDRWTGGEWTSWGAHAIAEFMAAHRLPTDTSPHQALGAYGARVVMLVAEISGEDGTVLEKAISGTLTELRRLFSVDGRFPTGDPRRRRWLQEELDQPDPEPPASVRQAVRRGLAQAASDTAPVGAAHQPVAPARIELRRRDAPLSSSALPRATASAGPWPRTNPFERARRGACDPPPRRERSRSVSPLPPEAPTSPHRATATAASCDTSAGDSPVAAPVRPRPCGSSRYIPRYPGTVASSSPSHDEDDGAGVFDRAFYLAHGTARGPLAARTMAAAPASAVAPVASVHTAPADSTIAAPVQPRPRRTSRFVPIYPVSRVPPPADPSAPLPETRAAPGPKRRSAETAELDERRASPKSRLRAVTLAGSKRHAASAGAGDAARLPPAKLVCRREAPIWSGEATVGRSESNGRNQPGCSAAARAAAASERRSLPGAAARASSQPSSSSLKGSKEVTVQGRSATVHPLAGRRTGPVATVEERAAAAAATNRGDTRMKKESFRITGCEDRFPYAIAHVIAENTEATAFMAGAKGAKYHIDVRAFSSAEEADTAGDGLARRHIGDCHVRQVLRSVCKSHTGRRDRTPSETALAHRQEPHHPADREFGSERERDGRDAGRRDRSPSETALAHRREPHHPADGAFGSERERDGRDVPGSSVAATAASSSERLTPPGVSARASSQRVCVIQLGSDAARSVPVSGREDPRATVRGSSQRCRVPHLRPGCGEASPLRSGNSVLRLSASGSESLGGGEVDPRACTDVPKRGKVRGTERPYALSPRKVARVSVREGAGPSGS
jgi:hypothetical protein